MKINRKIGIHILLLFGFLFSTGIVKADNNTPPIILESTPQNPVAVFLAGIIGVETEEILAYQDAGYGMGEIAKAYYLLELAADPLNEIVLLVFTANLIINMFVLVTHEAALH